MYPRIPWELVTDPLGSAEHSLVYSHFAARVYTPTVALTRFLEGVELFQSRSSSASTVHRLANDSSGTKEFRPNRYQCTLLATAVDTLLIS